ncbi:MAG: hypothetical protein HYS45_00005, partial [Parcubacteria group bacterium]|nr:hypothetical protein [Parcubacteria group bacterium]
MRVNFFRGMRMRASRAILALVLVLAFVAVIGFVFSNTGIIPRVGDGAPESTASADIAEFTVAGGSMLPVLEDGQTIRVHMAAYESTPIAAGDIVLIEQPGDNGYLVKIVKAIPGDTLALSAQPGRESQVVVNGEALTNSEGEPYLLPENKAAMI